MSCLERSIDTCSTVYSSRRILISEEMVQFLVKIFLIFYRFYTTVFNLDETIILDNKTAYW